MQKIIIKMPNWLGDLVMSTPVLKKIRTLYPSAHITAMCQSSISDLLLHNPHINEIWSYEKPKTLRAKKTLIKKLHSSQFNVGVLLTNSLSTAWWFFRGKVKERVGFASDMRSILLTKAIPFPKNRKTQHLVYTYLNLFDKEPKNPTPELYVSSQEKKIAKQLLINQGWNPNQKLIGIAPGAAFGTAKRWPPEQFKELTEKLTNENMKIVCLGTKNETPLSKIICHSTNSINLIGKTTLRELLAIISVTNVFIANDSGPMHVAAALKTPLIAIFGPTNPQVSRPYPKGTVLYKKVPCSPCHLRTCPKSHECMKAILVDDVYQTVKKLL